MGHQLLVPNLRASIGLKFSSEKLAIVVYNSAMRKLIVLIVMLSPLVSAQNKPKIKPPFTSTATGVTTEGTMTWANCTNSCGTGTGLAYHDDGVAGNLTITQNGLLVFGSSLTSTKPAGPPVTIAELRRSTHLLTEKDMAPAGYVALAKSVGAQPSSDEADILAAIKDLELPVYPFDKVDRYLSNKAYEISNNTRWVWKPISTIGRMSLQDLNGASTRAGSVSSSLYTQRIPMNVLNNIVALMGRVPGAVFLISDYETVNPDPFLAVTTPELLGSGKIWIVSQWDEPRFGLSEAAR